MAKKHKKSVPVAEKKKDTNIITINPDDIKVRKPFAPPTRWHQRKDIYRRKPKYPKPVED